MKPVEVLATDSDYAWVRGDLRSGEAIALEKQHYLRQGSQVIIQNHKDQ